MDFQLRSRQMTCNEDDDHQGPYLPIDIPTISFRAKTIVHAFKMKVPRTGLTLLLGPIGCDPKATLLA